MIPDGRGGYTAKRVMPGQSVPADAVSASGMSTLNLPTAATRAMAERAPRVIHFVDRINAILDENEASLGPLQSRWGEFMTGRVGLPNKDFAALRTNAGLLSTALMNMHVGARGSEKIMEHFQGLVNTSIQDPVNLRAALQEIRTYAQDVASERRAGIEAPGGPRPAPQAPPAGIKVLSDKVRE
jgi:hypothetical protein